LEEHLYKQAQEALLLKDPEEAAKRLMELVETTGLTPSQKALVFNSLGVTAFNTGKAALAGALLGEALRLCPDHFEATFNLGALCEAAGYQEGAMGRYQKCEQIAPGHPAVRDALGRLGSACKGKTKNSLGAIGQ